MINIGCHLSKSKGFTFMAKSIKLLGGNSFQYFARNPRGAVSKDIDLDDLNEFLDINKEEKIFVVAHAPYTMNLCSHSKHIREYSKVMFKEDLEAVGMIKNSFYNFHPGSHTGQGIQTGIKEISDALNDIIHVGQNTTVLLETMTGKGSEVGGRFEEIARIIDNVELKDKMGVCLDTCHVFDAGYDIVSDLEGVLEKFDKIIGISKLRVIHLNDSKNDLGSKKDRHEKLGKGKIGLNALFNIVNNRYLKDLVFILETPQDDVNGYKEEISLMKSGYES